MTRGGARKGAGKKNPYGEPTKQVKRMVPESRIPDFKKKTDKILKGYRKKK